MATNMLYKDGIHLKLAVADISSGDPVCVNDITGVALIDTDADGNVIITKKGVFDLEVVSTGATAIGESLYYHAGTPDTITNTTGVCIGYALEDIASDETDTIAVLLK